MKRGKLCLALAAMGSLAACDLVWDPGPKDASTGAIFSFPMYAVRPALPVCDEFDQEFSRKHIVTIKGAMASLASEGGVQADLPQVVPGIFRSEIKRNSLRMVVAFNDQHQTRTLTITELNNGCRWIGESRGPGEQWLPARRWPEMTDWWRR